MNMLNSQDLQNFSELMPKLYTLRTIEDFPDRILPLLAKLIDLDTTDRDRIDNRYKETTLRGANNFNVADRLPLKIFSPSIDRFPFFKHYLERHKRTAAKISDLSIESSLHRLEGGYWRFLKPIELEDRLGKVFVDPAHPATTHAIYLLQADAICLTVSRSRVISTERDRCILDLIRPHLVQAYQNALAFTEIQSQLDARESDIPLPQSEDGERLPPREPQVGLFSIESIRSLGLTNREAEVLFWIARDKSNGEIAKLFNCSLSTIKKHLEHIYQKLDVQSRTAAVMSALSQLGSIET
jgi:DNA-binding CsgD family transcriptional regulator